ncbi:acyl-CoA dehydrogenase family protein [Nocardia sp. NPDC052278]|uniref:acyl-CoA dehydrogenase family protein n=1 Tax=unclassified Nocardia TaxID=2637762 RepID=UPI0036996DCD
MSRHDYTLSEEQRDLRQMLASLATDRDVILSDELPDHVTFLAGELAQLGVWTMGASADVGGGGADAATVAVALEQVGRHWPALGWAAAQAHAAIDVLARADRCAEIRDLIHTRAAGIAVVDAASESIRLGWKRDRLVGSVARVDAAHAAPYLLVLSGDHDAVLVAPETITATPVRRTGLGGALTRSLRVDASAELVWQLHGVVASAARRRLHLGAAAIAVGIAGAAAEDAHAYASGRYQFGDALTAIPTVQASLFEQTSRTAVLDLAVRAAGADDLSAVAVARSACAAAIEICAAALQSYGGYGYLAEYPAERRLRDAVSLRAAADVEGSAVRAARAFVGLPSESRITKEAP